MRVEPDDNPRVALIPLGVPSSDLFTFTAVIKVGLVAKNKQIFLAMQRVTMLTDFDESCIKWKLLSIQRALTSHFFQFRPRSKDKVLTPNEMKDKWFEWCLFWHCSSSFQLAIIATRINLIVYDTATAQSWRSDFAQNSTSPVLARCYGVSFFSNFYFFSCKKVFFKENYYF